MTIKNIEGKYAIEISTKDEAVEIYSKLNKEYIHAPENAYDLKEVENLEYPLTITEDDLDECDTGFIMWSDDFWELIRNRDFSAWLKQFE